jgi:hypothetical protein
MIEGVLCVAGGAIVIYGLAGCLSLLSELVVFPTLRLIFGRRRR